MNDPYLPVSLAEVRALIEFANKAHMSGMSIPSDAALALQAVVNRFQAGHYYDPAAIQYEYWEEHWEETTTYVEHRPHWGLTLGKALWRAIS